MKTLNLYNVSNLWDRRKAFKSTILFANILEHFDTSLYGFLAPVIGREIFPSQDYIIQLILAYGILVLGIIARPMGGIYFSKLAVKKGAFTALIMALTGVGFATFLIGLIPTATDAYWYAVPIILVLSRTLMGFSAAGENAIAPYYILDHTNQSNSINNSTRQFMDCHVTSFLAMTKNIEKNSSSRGGSSVRRGDPGNKKSFMESNLTMSGIYQGSTIVGILLASAASSMLLSHNLAETYWRYLFLFSGIACMCTVLMRLSFGEFYKSQPLVNKFPIMTRIRENLRVLAMLIPIYGFSYLTYSISLVFLNPFLELTKVMDLNSALLTTNSLMIMDVLCCPIACFLIRKYAYKSCMQVAIIVFMMGAGILFLGLHHISIETIYLMRAIMVISGVVFSAAIIPWSYGLFREQDRYLINATSYSIGTETMGRMAPAICFCLYNITDNSGAPLIMIAITSILALIMIRRI